MSVDLKYYYTSDDFKGQDYVVTPDITRGEFMVPLVDDSGKKVGLLSWQSLAYPSEGNAKWNVQESLVISLGVYNDADTYNGSALSVATGGYYDMYSPYKFCVVSGKAHKLYVTITKTTATSREVFISREKAPDYLMDAQMSDIPENGLLDKIFIFRNNPLNLMNRTLTRPPGTLGSILVIGQGATFNDFGQIVGLESVEGASQPVAHKMQNVVLEGLGDNARDINSLTLVNLDTSSTFDNITVNNSQDDGIELFGGSVNMSNITVTNSLDDYFDTDHGHSGTITNLNLKQTDATAGKSLIECGNSDGTTTTKFVNLTYDGGNDISNYQNNGSDKNLNIKSGSSVEVNGVTLTQGQDEIP